MKFMKYLKTRSTQALVFFIYILLKYFILDTINTSKHTKLLILLLSFVFFFVLESINFKREYLVLHRLNCEFQKIEDFLLCDIGSQSSYSLQAMSDLLENFKLFFENYLNDANNKQQDFRDYLDIWVHEIKTPLSGLLLLMENKADFAQKVEVIGYLKQIEYYADQIVSVSKLETVNKDYQVQSFYLDDSIASVLSELSFYFINKNLSLIWEREKIAVFSDRMWIEFILKQCLLNAIQFTPFSKSITIETKKQENNVVLIIKDDGIGIAADKLPRIFERGFTAREYARSTGMGLYLVKQACDQLGIKLSAESIDGFSLKFVIPQSDHHFRM